MTELTAEETQIFSMAEDDLNEIGYDSRAAYLISNMFDSIEIIRMETGYHEYQIMRVKTTNENMKSELRFIKAVCEELLKEDDI